MLAIVVAGEAELTPVEARPVFEGEGMIQMREEGERESYIQITCCFLS